MFQNRNPACARDETQQEHYDQNKRLLPFSQLSPPLPSGHSQYCIPGAPSSRAQAPPGPQSLVHAGIVTASGGYFVDSDCVVCVTWTASPATGNFCSRLGLWDVTPEYMVGVGELLEKMSLENSFVKFVNASSAENDASFWYKMSSPSSVKPSGWREFDALRSENIKKICQMTKTILHTMNSSFFILADGAKLRISNQIIYKSNQRNMLSVYLCIVTEPLNFFLKIPLPVTLL